MGLSLLLGGCEATLFAGLNATDQRQGIVAQRSVEFDKQQHLALDVYRPIHAIHAPVVVFFYGGSWVRGQRNWYRFVGASLASHGVTVVIPDYRKYPQVTMDGFMHDAAEAVAWTFDHAEELDASPEDIFIMGHSAGGQIAALLATDPSWLTAYGRRPNDLAGLIGLAGCYDFVPIPPFEKDMLDVFGRSTQEQLRAEPVHFVTGHEPPMLLLHGTADKEVDIANTYSLDNAMLAQHEDVTMRVYPGMGHSSLVFSLSRPLGHEYVLKDILDFISRHQTAEHK
ncbi:carboxylesterase [Dyella sp. GSA-30]|nr:carboxylesterase [Dyella sp. GSA-30]